MFYWPQFYLDLALGKSAWAKGSTMKGLLKYFICMMKGLAYQSLLNVCVSPEDRRTGACPGKASSSAWCPAPGFSSWGFDTSSEICSCIVTPLQSLFTAQVDHLPHSNLISDLISSCTSHFSGQPSLFKLNFIPCQQVVLFHCQIVSTGLSAMLSLLLITVHTCPPWIHSIVTYMIIF